MGTPRDPQPVKLVFSLLSGDAALLTRAREGLVEVWGPLDLESDLLPFDHTQYYAAEFGSGLARRVVSMEQLIPAENLPTIKLQTNEMEWSLSEAGHRNVNIDPGYVSLGKLVLATTKDHAHRLYLGQGIYGEVTLTYQQGRFRPWPWTYPDYRSDFYCSLFDGIRVRYKTQLRERT